MGIPTVVGFADGKEILRRTGMQSPEALELIFDVTLHQRKTAIIPSGANRPLDPLRGGFRADWPGIFY